MKMNFNGKKIDIPKIYDLADAVAILKAAYSVASNCEEEAEFSQRIRRAIIAIGQYTLEGVERAYEEKSRKYSVTVSQTNSMDVEASSVEEAKKKAIDKATDRNNQGTVPDVIVVKEII